MATPPGAEATARWERLVGQMLATSRATAGDGPKRAFGSTSLKTEGRIFAMLIRDHLVVKLPADRVVELVSAGEGRPFDPGHGRIQREWLEVTADDESRWLELAFDSKVSSPVAGDERPPCRRNITGDDLGRNAGSAVAWNESCAIGRRRADAGLLGPRS